MHEVHTEIHKDVLCSEKNFLNFPVRSWFIVRSSSRTVRHVFIALTSGPELKPSKNGAPEFFLICPGAGARISKKNFRLRNPIPYINWLKMVGNEEIHLKIFSVEKKIWAFWKLSLSLSK